MLDERIPMSLMAKEFGGNAIALRKRHFPIPVKVFGVDLKTIKKNIEECFSTVGMLIGGGKEFILRCGKTESMKVDKVI
jgi:hypothetical protein